MWQIMGLALSLSVFRVCSPTPAQGGTALLCCPEDVQGLLSRLVSEGQGQLCEALSSLLLEDKGIMDINTMAIMAASWTLIWPLIAI